MYSEKCSFFVDAVLKYICLTLTTAKIKTKTTAKTVTKIVTAMGMVEMMQMG